MVDLSEIRTENYAYELPQEKISQYPLSGRDQSKLCIYKDGEIVEETFKNIDAYLPSNGLLVFNDTKVIQARLLFRKPTGAQIELFCLEPLEPTGEIMSAFQQRSPVVWKCLIGNLKRWKNDHLKLARKINNQNCFLYAENILPGNNPSFVRFSWTPQDQRFSEIVDKFGILPLPPYIRREVEPQDSIRYQTIYARNEGSVAAPTAGLHFTEEVLEKIKKRGIDKKSLILHVGAATFKPVTSPVVDMHEMHEEQVYVPKALVEALLHTPERPVIAVGTTTIRTLESLYWFGLNLINGESSEFHINQWDPYRKTNNSNPTVEQVLKAVMHLMEKNDMQGIHGTTRLMIVPGYDYKIAKVLITNFHQPRSTLLLLVAAFIGDHWKDVYQFALDHNFRFLSYGDSCLFFKKQ